MSSDAGAGLGFLVFLFLLVPGLVLFICWVVLPFAVVGTKPLLRRLITETRRSNELVEKQIAASERLALLVARSLPANTAKNEVPPPQHAGKT